MAETSLVESLSDSSWGEVQVNIRAFYRATKVENAQPPYDTINLKVFYPGKMSGSEQQQNQGIVPADRQQAPFPVVILFNGFNTNPELYKWLAIKLSERGMVVVTFAWVAENFPGVVALTPGVDIAMLAPDTYGTAPTASALPALLTELERINSEGILAGMLDLQKIILGGHSAGGRVAIESASPNFFSQVVAAFGYGVHTAAGTMMGYEAATILPLPDLLPLLLIGGTRDGVIANSSHRYGTVWKEATTPVSRTFHEAISGGRNDSYLMLVEGANHFSFADPFDPTTGRPFLDFPATQPEDEIRSLMAETIGLFIDAHVRQQSTASDKLKELLNDGHPLIKSLERK
ncbi:MAG: dienelactone hydrolase [Okeania sp. SIO4D6]|nr:dienelactone hydrolase [Okeania sp. SIO4D6]NEP39665.1 dienelactone hydrolase [Okeania sp. SIO2H7]NEP75963.1 dienelactone hydrolase [Okeania sp. SIO2G5]